MIRSQHHLIVLLILSLAACGESTQVAPDTSPKASFDVGCTTIAGTPIVTRNSSLNAHSYLWTLPDGSTSTDRTPTLLLTTPGEYSISLVARSSDGRSDSARRTFTLYPPPLLVAE